MPDIRKFMATVCVKSGTTRARLELADAARHGGPAGRYRVRIDRRWHDQPDGADASLLSPSVGLARGARPTAAAWLDPTDVGTLVAALLAGSSVPDAVPPRPDLPRGTRVSAPNGRESGGLPMRDSTRTATEPVLGYDGRWLVGVILCGRGVVMVPVDDLVVRDGVR